MNPMDQIPLYQSALELNSSFQSYKANPDKTAAKKKIGEILDRCLEDYENAIIFLQSPPNGPMGLEFGKSYSTMRTLDSWHESLPVMISNISKIHLDQYVAPLKNMQNDKRYQPTFKTT